MQQISEPLVSYTTHKHIQSLLHCADAHLGSLILLHSQQLQFHTHNNNTLSVSALPFFLLFHPSHFSGCFLFRPLTLSTIMICIYYSVTKFVRILQLRFRSRQRIKISFSPLILGTWCVMALWVVNLVINNLILLLLSSFLLYYI